MDVENLHRSQTKSISILSHTESGTAVSDALVVRRGLGRARMYACKAGKPSNDCATTTRRCSPVTGTGNPTGVDRRPLPSVDGTEAESTTNLS